MEIRALAETDRSQMLMLMQEFWLKYNRGELLTPELKEIEELKDPVNLMQAELEKYFGWHTLVAEEGSQLLGFVAARVKTEEHKVLEKVGYIEELFVTTTARGQKLGSKLMEKIISVLQQQGCTVLGVDAYAMNTAALGLYRKFGFIDKAIVLTRKA